ncbi:NRPS protein [Claviceps lovelessii]|nr:NRPS protein [Claviceps lovelessii]
MPCLDKWRTFLHGYIPCTFPALSDNETTISDPPTSVTATLPESSSRLTRFSNNRSIDAKTRYPSRYPRPVSDPAESISLRTVLYPIFCLRCKETAARRPIFAMSPCRIGRKTGSREQVQFDIVILFDIDETTARITLTYQTSILHKPQAIAVANTVQQAVSEIVTGKDRLQFCLLHAKDSICLSLRNKQPADISNDGIEALIYRRCCQTPSALAVRAWDGNCSYAELNSLSRGLMHCLRDAGIGPDMFVPILFEKSRWAVIAMLGVVKAGAAFVLLDPTHPRQRLRGICDKVSARLIVSSAQQAGLAAELVGHVVTVGEEDMKSSSVTADVNQHQNTGERPDRGSTECMAAPHNALYAVFTSGSTGAPKGVVSNHSSFLAAMPVYLESLELSDKSRVFQFASFAFDVSIFDVLMTLVAGGCVCVPSNTDRSSDLANAIQRFGATHLSITPTVARVLNPREVSSLETIVLGGEPPAPDDVRSWIDHDVRVVQLYGASECAIMSIRCTSRTPESPSSDTRTTTYDTGSCCWLVGPRNHEQLQPVGAIGELVVEGPVVGREYLDDVIQTSETFIEAPTWLRELRQDDTGGRFRVYKSGDLVRIAADGSIQFICRKNTQVKLRGQRIELGEVQHHLQKAFPSATECIAELVTSLDASRPPMLVAFVFGAATTEAGVSRSIRGSANDSITAGRHATLETVLAEPTPSFRSQIAAASSRLKHALPSYMVPSAMLPLKTVPLTSTDKINRKLLRQLAGGLSHQELQRYQPQRSAYRTPRTDAERTVQTLFANVLSLPVNQIGADDNFFSLGGDSLTAMKMVARARKETRFGLTVQDVFDHPRLSELAQLTKTVTSEDKECQVRGEVQGPPAPFSLVRGQKQSVIRDAARQCQLPSRAIEDVYPCTPLQSALLGETMRDGAAFVSTIELALPMDIQLDRLQQAWAAVAKANPILRTRMMLSSSYGLLQVVVREELSWIASDDAACQDVLQHVVGRPLSQLVLHRDHADKGVESNGRPATLLLHIHHALSDGFSLLLMIAEVHRAYCGRTLEHRPVSPFIRYVTNILPDAATNYWRCLCRGLQAPPFPALPRESYRPCPDSKTTQVVALSTSWLNSHATEYTLNTHVRLAWAMTQAHQQSLLDICYGTVVYGRNAPVRDIESMMIPTVATIPCRVTLHRDRTVRQTLDEIQDMATRGIPFEQFGLVEIARSGHDAATACRFQTLLVLQPALSQREDQDLLRLSDPEASYRPDATCAINLFCIPANETVRVTALHDESIVPTCTMRTMLNNFGQTLQTIHADPSRLFTGCI